MHDPEQQPSEHQSYGNLGIDSRPAITKAIAIGGYRTSSEQSDKWRCPAMIKGSRSVPKFGKVQWTGDDTAWEAICDLHADSELVAFRESNDTVSIETPDGWRVAAKVGDWIVRTTDGFHIDAA
ncbi:hypothetical protein [Reyranella soli]|uniref:hypothetical protein n=1 Tax=Reyranella soli TaxID=1230389 RepID=UPI0014783426|nr:hypothetical protein [Reyranella soli]